MGSFKPKVSLISALSRSDVSSPTILFTGSPTKVKSENDTKATTNITNIDWNNLLKKYFVKI
jgi:hypothetical protein